MINPCCMTNGSCGYYPTYDAYIEGGYEARASSFKCGVAETIISEGRNMLQQLK